MRRFLLALTCLWAALPAAAADRQFLRPPVGHTDDLEFTVAVQKQVKGTCLSYWGSNGKNWATLMLSKSMLQQLAAKGEAGAKQLLAAIAPGRDDWGCQHIKDVTGTPLDFLFTLIESGAVKVIDDANGTAVSSIVVRYPVNRYNQSTYHLNPDAGAFLTRNPFSLDSAILAEQERQQPRRPWQIETLALTPNNRDAIKFARRFVASCTGKSRTDWRFYQQHLNEPLKVRFTVVSGEENGNDNDNEIETIPQLHPDPANGKIGLPLCVGDGGLDDVTFTPEKSGFTLALNYGSGPNEVLQFARIKGQWRLTFAEWFDH